MAVMSVHHPLAFTFGILGNAISFMVYLAPLPTFVRIYKKKCTESFQALPYLVALFSCMMWLYYAMLKKDALLLITINSFGCLIETLYISLYIAYAPKVNRAWTIKFMVLVNMGLFSSILLVTHFLVKGSACVQILGWICVAISVAVFAAPLNIVAQVIRTKSVEFMPITLSVFLTLSAVMWLAYGLFSKDICVALPNVVGFTLGVVQMLLYAFYRKGKTVVTQEERLKGTGVVAATLGNSEVYPTKEQQGPEPITTNHQSLQIPSQHITHESPV